jgi:hypothetical protein
MPFYVVTFYVFYCQFNFKIQLHNLCHYRKISMLKITVRIKQINIFLQVKCIKLSQDRAPAIIELGNLRNT